MVKHAIDRASKTVTVQRVLRESKRIVHGAAILVKLAAIGPLQDG